MELVVHVKWCDLVKSVSVLLGIILSIFIPCQPPSLHYLTNQYLLHLDCSSLQIFLAFMRNLWGLYLLLWEIKLHQRHLSITLFLFNYISSLYFFESNLYLIQKETDLLNISGDRPRYRRYQQGHSHMSRS